MLLSEKIKIKWERRNKTHYINLGYDFTFIGDTFYVDSNHLPNGSHVRVTIICDYCGKPKTQVFKDYIKTTVNGVIHKDSCTKCMPKKLEESLLVTHGVKNASCLESVVKKRKQSIFDRFGVENIMHIDEICNDVINKTRQSMYQNGTAPCSKQQKYLHNLLGGKLNYPIDKYALDIAFPEEKIFIECDFSGHDLSVKMGNLTIDDFKNKEKARSYYLRNLGWKEIRIISTKDKLPSKNKILEMICFAREYLQKGYSWLKFNIDKNEILSSQFNNDYNYGELRLIKQSDIITI